jgi:hypothetical protein
MTDVIIGDDFTLRINGARDPDAAAGVYLTTATVTYTLYTAAGVSVTTGSLPYVAASNGNYRGVIESTVTSTLTSGGLYYIIFVLVQGNYDWTDRLDLVAKPPGGGILTPDVWSEITGIALDSTNSAAIARMALAVSSALTRKCYPILLEPKILTLAPFDAPTRPELFLPRPIRSISAIYLHSGANGDSSVLDLTADLLVAGTDYYSPSTDVLTGWNRTGIVYRRNSSCWGVEYRRPLGMLASVAEADKGSVFVSGAFGPTTVDPAVQEAAAMIVTLWFNRRKEGAPYSSESWNGRSQSLSGDFLKSALNSPDVTDALMSAGVLPIHVG